jgi:hypothetical protein
VLPPSADGTRPAAPTDGRTGPLASRRPRPICQVASLGVLLAPVRPIDLESQKALGIDPLRDLYDLRHTYATFALRAGVPVFAVSRFMGTSIAMIDLHYGHLAVDSFEHAVSLLDALALERAVDAGWTPAPRPARPHPHTISAPRGRRSRRAVDARWTSRSEALATSAVRKG